jgi:hypothetical protein
MIEIPEMIVGKDELVEIARTFEGNAVRDVTIDFDKGEGCLSLQALNGSLLFRFSSENYLGTLVRAPPKNYIYAANSNWEQGHIEIPGGFTYMGTCHLGGPNLEDFLHGLESNLVNDIKASIGSEGQLSYAVVSTMNHTIVGIALPRSLLAINYKPAKGSPIEFKVPEEYRAMPRKLHLPRLW